MSETFKKNHNNTSPLSYSWPLNSVSDSETLNSGPSKSEQPMYIIQILYLVLFLYYILLTSEKQSLCSIQRTPKGIVSCTNYLCEWTDIENTSVNHENKLKLSIVTNCTVHLLLCFVSFCPFSDSLRLLIQLLASHTPMY